MNEVEIVVVVVVVVAFVAETIGAEELEGAGEKKVDSETMGVVPVVEDITQVVLEVAVAAIVGINIDFL